MKLISDQTVLIYLVLPAQVPSLFSESFSAVRDIKMGDRNSIKMEDHINIKFLCKAGE
jgi:hypothetical protein